jgi:hypothetical protein
VSALQTAVTESIVLTGSAPSWNLLMSVNTPTITTADVATLFKNGQCISGPLCGATVATVTHGFDPVAVITTLPTSNALYQPVALVDTGFSTLGASTAAYQVTTTESSTLQMLSASTTTGQLAPAESSAPVQTASASQSARPQALPLTPAAAQLVAMMSELHEKKRLVLEKAVAILERDPSAADLKQCTSNELGGDCIMPRPSRAVLGETRVAPTPAEEHLPVIQRKRALLIGVGDYQNGIPKLNSPLKDVQDVAKLYREQFGYEVRTLRNADKASIVRELNRLILESGPNDSITIFYAGHGQLIEKTGRGYWIPAHASADDPTQWISNQDIGKALENIPAKQVLLVSDSCYSGSLTRDAKVQKVDVLADPAAVLARRSVTVLSSGGEEPVADAGKEGHSVFAWHFMQSLKKVQGWQRGVDLYDNLAADVKQDFPQEPQYGEAIGSGHQRGGDFLFEVRKY